MGYARGVRIQLENTMRLRFLFVLVAAAATLLVAPSADAQRSRHADTWNFGVGCRMQWNADASMVSVSRDPVISTAEGCASFSDPDTGALLLYTDGTRVWNAAGAPIISDLPGHPSSLHSGVIVPRPLTPGRVFVVGHGFNMTANVSFREFDVSGATPTAVGATNTTVTLDGGALTGQEGMVMTQHSNGLDYWLIINGANFVFVLPVTSTGIGAVRKIPTGIAGEVFNVFTISNAGDRLIISNRDGGSVFSFDFNNTTGAVTGKTTLFAQADNQKYGGTFSPDDTKLYFSSLGRVGERSNFYQWDFTSSTLTLINSRAARYTNAASQLGPDGKIYVATGRDASTSLSVVDNPNAAGVACGFRYAAIPMAAGCNPDLGLPQTVSPQAIIALGIQVTGPAGTIAETSAVAPEGTANVPNGTTVNVTVTGPGGFMETCTATVSAGAWMCPAGSISGLTPGDTYTITASVSPTVTDSGTFTVGDCGDGIVEAVEACDDGNNAAGDGCSATCTEEPGFTCGALLADTGEDIDGTRLAIGEEDCRWRVSASDDFTASSPLVTVDGTMCAGSWLAATEAQWVSLDDTACGSTTASEVRYYHQYFDVPAAAVGSVALEIQCNVDNLTDVFINGTNVGTCTVFTAAPATITVPSSVFVAGENVISFDVLNTSTPRPTGNPQGLMAVFTSSSVCRRGGPAACECVADTDCGDMNECTADSCSGDSCVNAPVAAGTMCTGGVCSGATAMCVECVSDAQCGGSMPICDVATNSCVACRTGADCDDGNDCTVDACVASSCTSTASPAGTMCAGGVCDGLSPAMCLPCIDTMAGAGTDAGCSASAPLCISAGGTSICVPCVDDASGGADTGCSGASPVCDASTPAAAVCVECEDSAAMSAMDFGCDAAAGTGICLDGPGMAPDCVECVNDADCPVMGEVCGPANTCVPGCNDMSDCAGTDTPICDLDARTCVECLDDSHCPGITSCGPMNTCEFPDSDLDGTPDDVDLDDDNDGIPDVDENDGADPSADADMDGVPDYLDPEATGCADADSNGVCDEVPAEIDFDGDGLPNHLDLDADGDGIADIVEGGGEDMDGDGVVDGFTDGNGNGIADSVEAEPLPLPNSDGTDGPDFLDLDSDDDGLTDTLEGGGVDADGDGAPDGPTTDADMDGLADELTGDDALPTPDTDEDGTPDYQDPDDDDDGLPTATEVVDAGEYDGPAADPTDVDGDGLPNWHDTDSDGDGVEDDDEDTRPGEDGDLDDNGLLDYLDPDFAPVDSDGDGIVDGVECPGVTPPDATCRDSDGDMVPDYLDVDDDNDGILTEDEYGAPDPEDGDPANDHDADNDGIPNHLDLDADNDGIPDLVENGDGGLDTDGDGVPDDLTDADMDGLIAAFDADDADPDNTGTDVPTNTDGTGPPDFLDLDADDDGLLDIIEADGVDADSNGVVDSPADADGDGLADVVDGTPWPTPDTDGDGAFDFQDVDSDDDTVPDAVEGFDGDGDGVPDTIPSGMDANGDGVDDARLGSAPPLPDTDGDGMPNWRDPDDDGDGVFTRFEAPDPNGDGDPSDARDTDANGVPDYLDPDDDGDGTPTLEEGADPNGDGDPADALNSDGVGLPDYLDPGGVEPMGDGGFSGGALCATNGAPGNAGWFLAAMMFALGWRRRR